MDNLRLKYLTVDPHPTWCFNYTCSLIVSFPDPFAVLKGGLGMRLGH